MAQRYNDDYGSQRSGRGGRPDYDESQEQRGRERQRWGSRHTMHDDDVPDVRFGRNVGDPGEYAGGGERDFIDETSQGQHSGYGDYGQQDYRGQSGGREWQRLGGRRERDYRRSEFTRTDFDRDEFGRTRQYGAGGYQGSSSPDTYGGTGYGTQGSDDFRSTSFGGPRRFGRGDYRGNVGTGGYGYAESNYGPGRVSRGGGQDWASNQWGQNEATGARSPQGYGGSQFGSESRYSGQGRSYGGGYESYRGRGPRGYTRSDERLKEIVCEMLTDADDIDASDIEVTVTEAVVVLDGAVGDRWTKYQAEEMAGQVPGVKDVRNQLRVQASGSQREQSSQGGTGTSGTGTSGTSGTSGSSSSTYGTSESTTGSSARKGSAGSSTPKTG